MSSVLHISRTLHKHTLHVKSAVELLQLVSVVTKLLLIAIVHYNVTAEVDAIEPAIASCITKRISNLSNLMPTRQSKDSSVHNLHNVAL